MYQLIPIDEISTEPYEHKGFFRDEVSASLNHSDKVLSDKDFIEFINFVCTQFEDFIIEIGYYEIYKNSEEFKENDMEGFIIENNLNNQLLRNAYNYHMPV